MRHLLPAIVVALMVLAQGCVRDGPPLAAAAQQELEEAAAIAAAEMRRQDIPGMAVVVMEGDRVALARGFGLESTARPDPVTPDTVFMYNSISKQFVAAAVMKLAERRRLLLDDPVARLLPDWRQVPPTLLVRHLLSHTSGMRDEHVQPALRDLFDWPGTSRADYAAAARDTPSDWAPGTRWSYANVNYLMLTLILERTTGQPLEEALDELLLRPLGFASIRPCPAVIGARAGVARGHVLRSGALAGHDPEPAHLFRGSGGYCGTALDLARWTRALATGRIVSPASYEAMTARTPLAGGGSADYGFAFSLVRPDGIARIGHGGYGGGFSAQAAYYPDMDRTVVVMTNRFRQPESIERKLIRHPLLIAPAHEEVPLTPAERRRFTGRFDVGVHGWHPRVEERGGRLWFALPGPPIEFPLVHVGEGVLAAADDPDGYRLAFSDDRSELRLLGMGLMTWYGRRVDGEAP